MGKNSNLFLVIRWDICVNNRVISLGFFLVNDDGLFSMMTLPSVLSFQPVKNVSCESKKISGDNFSKLFFIWSKTCTKNAKSSFPVLFMLLMLKIVRKYFTCNNMYNIIYSKLDKACQDPFCFDTIVEY